MQKLFIPWKMPPRDHSQVSTALKQGLRLELVCSLCSKWTCHRKCPELSLVNSKSHPIRDQSTENNLLAKLSRKQSLRRLDCNKIKSSRRTLVKETLHLVQQPSEQNKMRPLFYLSWTNPKYQRYLTTMMWCSRNKFSQMSSLISINLTMET